MRRRGAKTGLMLAYALGGALLAGCGEGGGLLVGSVITGASEFDDISGPGAPARDPGLRDLGAEAVEIRRTGLVSTPGGCEIEVTYRNVTDRSLSIGFTYRALDQAGRELKRLSTPVQSTGPGETRTLTSGSTTDGPSGLSCGQIARTELVSVSARNF